MSRRLAFPLPELLQVLERQLIAGEIEDAVQQHRRVARRQYEAVAIQPAWIARIVAEMLCPQHVGERGERHRSAGVTGVRLLNGVHRKNSDRVDAEVLERLPGSGRSGRGCWSGSGRGIGGIRHGIRFENIGNWSSAS